MPNKRKERGKWNPRKKREIIEGKGEKEKNTDKGDDDEDDVKAQASRGGDEEVRDGMDGDDDRSNCDRQDQLDG